MSIIRVILGLVLTAGLIGTSGAIKAGPSTALAASIDKKTVLARDAATSRADIKLTNSCIEAGQSKYYCLCVTKVFKHEMSLYEYEAAGLLYHSRISPAPTAISAAKISLKQQGYLETEINHVDNLQRRLLDSAKLENRCAVADAYFSQNLN